MKNVIKYLNQLNHRGTGALTILGILFTFNKTLILSLFVIYCLEKRLINIEIQLSLPIQLMNESKYGYNSPVKKPLQLEIKKSLSIN